MLFPLLYYLLLALGPLLLWPALRLKGMARAWLLIVVAAVFAAIVYEIWMWYGRPADIRFDLLLLGPAVLCLYVSAVGVLLWGQWRKTAALLALLLVLVGAGGAYVWISAGRESARLTEVFHASNALLFEAKFRSLDAYQSYFGVYDARPSGFPAGHWLAQGEGNFTRLIVNPEGRAWLFFRCGETECHHGPGEQGLEAVGDAAWKTWKAELKPRVGKPVALRIIQESRARLSVEVAGQTLVFGEAPPPIDAAPARESLVFLGPFAGHVCQGQHARLRQLWLWQEETRLYVVGIFDTLVAGQHAQFISPVVLGEGVPDGDGWAFGWERGGQTWKASVALEGFDGVLTLQREGQDTETIRLERRAIIRDEVIELAPRTSKADWDHWFDNVLTGHFSSGKVPAC